MDSSCENSTGDTADHPPRDAYHTVLTIAGSDPSGGAGIQADLKTIGALGCYGLSVIAVVTVQDTRGVRSMYPLAPSLIRDQLEVLWSDAPPDAVKTGLLPGPEQIEIVADTLRGHGPPPLVVDPVLGPSRGPLALSEDAVEAMKRHLFPLATLLTPNLPEASRLTGLKVIDRQGMAAAAKKLAESGCPYVLVKGGHLEGDHCLDLLYLGPEDRSVTFEAERIPTVNTHGTGCTLSAALASFLAKGLPTVECVGRARDYLREALREGGRYTLGKGNGPLHHFHRWW